MSIKTKHLKVFNLTAKFRGNTIQNACKKIMEGTDDLKGFTNFLLQYFDDKNCSDVSYKTSVEEIKNTKFGNGMSKFSFTVTQPWFHSFIFFFQYHTVRQWFYQTCNEYGWYQTSGSMKQPFGTKFPAQLYTTLCQDAYGEQFTEDYIAQQVAKTNEFFGGLDLQVENVYMTHGQLDPWRAMGIQETSKATIIPSKFVPQKKIFKKLYEK